MLTAKYYPYLRGNFYQGDHRRLVESKELNKREDKLTSYKQTGNFGRGTKFSPSQPQRPTPSDMGEWRQISSHQTREGLQACTHCMRKSV